MRDLFLLLTFQQRCLRGFQRHWTQGDHDCTQDTYLLLRSREILQDGLARNSIERYCVGDVIPDNATILIDNKYRGCSL